MIRMTRLPEEVTRLLTPLKPYFSYRHYLVFCWLLVAHLVCFGKATVQGLARYTPTHVAAWHLRRLLAAGRWQWEQVLHWLVSEALAAFPPPKDGVLYLVVDSTLKGKRGKKNPLAKKGRLNEYAPFTFGLHVVIVIAQWDVYRIPLAFRLGQTQSEPRLSIGECAGARDARRGHSAGVVQESGRGRGCGLSLARQSASDSSPRLVLCHRLPAHLEAGQRPISARCGHPFADPSLPSSPCPLGCPQHPSPGLLDVCQAGAVGARGRCHSGVESPAA